MNYLLVHDRFMQPNCVDGFKPNPIRLGFLDFMRELSQEDFPFKPSDKLMLVGLDDVLLLAGQNRAEVEAHIHNVLAGQANNLATRMGTNIQIIFKSPLKQADDFWFEVGARNRVSLKGVFHAAQFQCESGLEWYSVGFNLT
jgi:hypothetical protein